MKINKLHSLYMHSNTCIDTGFYLCGGGGGGGCLGEKFRYNPVVQQFPKFPPDFYFCSRFLSDDTITTTKD